MGDKLCPSRASSRSPNLSFAVHESPWKDKRVQLINWRASAPSNNLFVAAINFPTVLRKSLHHPYVGHR